MTKKSPTCIGRVRHVLGSTVTVALNDDLAGVAPIYRGRLQPVGQIGSLVRIPQGLVDLVAVVSLVGISELTGVQPPVEALQCDERWLQVQLLGEIDRGLKEFRRGVASYPGLDDEVHFATPEELSTVFPSADEKHLRFGCLTAAEEVPLCLNASKLVVRHSAIVGSTGAGKTCAVSTLLQSFIRGGWNAANIVVVDPHGEYANALGDHSSTRSVLGEGEGGLRVPYWALPAMDILKVFAGGTGGATFQSRFSELVTEARRSFAAASNWIELDASSITADTPIPFDIKPVWYLLDCENRETRQNKSDPSTVQMTDAGDPSTLKPATFEPYNPASEAPHKGPKYDIYQTMPSLLRLGLLNPQLKFFQSAAGEFDQPDPLVSVLQEWLGGIKPVSVLDFSGVPGNAADLAIGVILNLIFEVAVRCQAGDPGIGRPRPVMIILEEAHRYLGEDANPLARDAANRIAREGRKYGVGLQLVTQRPTELPKTALAQCGTIIALRLTSSEDQSAVKAALPDAIGGLASILPSLRTHEAIISGEAVILPSRICIDNPNPWPKAEDPSLLPWREVATLPDIADALKAWRGTFA